MWLGTSILVEKIPPVQIPETEKHQRQRGDPCADKNRLMEHQSADHEGQARAGDNFRRHGPVASGNFVGKIPLRQQCLVEIGRDQQQGNHA